MLDVILLLFAILEPVLFVNQHLSMFLWLMFRTIFLPACFLLVVLVFFALVPVPIILVIIIVVFGKGGVWWLGVAQGGVPRGGVAYG